MNPADDLSVSDARKQPVSRYEFWSVVTITLLGAIIRFAFPSAMAIEHFDEGVYASNLLFPDQGFRYPDRHLYAPSLVSALIEWSIIAFGDKGIAPLLPVLIFGTLTIPLIWWAVRQWFGPLAGLAAATLLSLSDFHIAFSRSALTDVPFCFWLLLAVYFFERAFCDFSWPAAIAAGVTTGVAWWTKYNGWLPLAISLSGLMAGSLFARREERHFLRRLALWTVAAVTALLVWSPYWLSLPNGYAEIARNHGHYIVGFDGWTNGWFRQIESLAAFNSPATWGGLVIVAAVVGGIGSWFQSTPRSWSLHNLIAGIPTPIVWCFAVVVVATVSISGMAMSVNRLLLILVLLGLVLGISVTVTLRFICWRDRNSTLSVERDPWEVGLRYWLFQRTDWLLAAWVSGLTLCVPLYRPYPRLALPWLVGVIILTCRLYGARPTLNRTPPTSNQRMQTLIVFVIGFVAILITNWGSIPADSFRFRPWESRSQLREIARDVTKDALQGVRASKLNPIQNTHIVLYVYAEPGLFFHLPADGLAVQPAGNLDFVDIPATRKLPTFLVTGPHARRSKVFSDEFAKRANQFELVASYPYDASDFVRLDDVSASQLRAHREPLDVRLYRVRVPD